VRREGGVKGGMKGVAPGFEKVNIDRTAKSMILHLFFFIL
jgi:hypothetical protein